MSSPLGEPPLPAEMRVPDDARELAADAVAVRAELRAEAKASRRRLRRAGPRLHLLLIGSVLVASLGVLVPMVLGRSRPAVPLAKPAPLRELVDERVGEVGGLLPAADIWTFAGERTARELRPAVLVLIPPGCACDAHVRHIAAETARHPVPVHLLGGASKEINRVIGESRGRVRTLVNRDGALARTYLTDGSVTLVLVRSDGVVSRIVRGVRPGLSLDAAMDRLLRPAA